MAKIIIILSLLTLLISNNTAQINRTFNQLINFLAFLDSEFKDFTNYLEYGEKISPPKDEDVRLTMEPDQLINYYRYNGEKHEVETKDEFKLVLYRITGNITHPDPTGKPAVLIQHGLISSSMDWLISGKNRSLAFILADKGFDVWLGNSRGCSYSSQHKSLDLKESKYWNFSWHEIGVIDLPTVIDYILNTTKNKKITYIGHSQGTTASYVMLSEKPEYNDKITALFSLAPVAYCSNINPILRLVAPFSDQIYKNLKLQRIYELSVKGNKHSNFIRDFCTSNNRRFLFCKNIVFMMAGRSEVEFDSKLYRTVLKYFPNKASSKQVHHYAQLILSGRFRQYDYGPELNKKKYNSIIPPDYKIKNIKVPTTLFFSDNDLFASPIDVGILYRQLPNVNKVYRVNDPSFNHFDFLWGKHVIPLLYNKLVSSVINAQNNASTNFS